MSDLLWQMIVGFSAVGFVLFCFSYALYLEAKERLKDKADQDHGTDKTRPTEEADGDTPNSQRLHPTVLP